jgi:protein-S-isoprenylcysteine O-methyltransferase Ste14
MEQALQSERVLASIEEANMFIAFRAVTYATCFIGFLLIYLPARILSWAGITRPAGIAWPQLAGMTIGIAGATVALWCIFTFVGKGRGTPAPFDPPRRLVIQGPYRIVRNPMYMGAAVALAGSACFYKSAALLVYGVIFLITAHLFVIGYEEPTLRRTFGQQYEAYCRRTSRWWPRPRAVS